MRININFLQKQRKRFFSSCVFALGCLVCIMIHMPNASADRSKPADFLTKIEGAEYVGTETCVLCHEGENREYQLSPHSRVELDVEDGEVVQGCETCHGPGSIHADAGGGKDNIMNPRQNPQMCFSCHLDKKAEFSLPYRHPVMEGKMSCSDCHSSHGTDARPWTRTSLEGVNASCFKCHKEQRGPFVFEHEALREGCTTCHKVHGSINDKMLIVRDINLCLRCHTQQSFPTVGNRTHSASNFTQGTCFTAGCHTAMHGSNFDDHLRY